MKYYFCTLFDINFLHRGLAMYNSCIKHGGDGFTMWILCLDEASKKILDGLNLHNAVILTVSDLNNKELEATKSGRSNSEFAWTCKHSLIRYAISKIPEGEIINYIDADLFLFAHPQSVYEELGENSILITPHRFEEEEKAREKKVGSFNAGMIFMRKDDISRRCLSRWTKQCLDWCFAKYEETRYGDQKYLDEWPTLYPKVVVSKNKGLNIGTWNIQKYSVTKQDGQIFIDDKILTWYHFHGFRAYLNRKGKLCAYPASMTNDIIYKPYVEALNESVSQIRKSFPEFRPATNAHPGYLRLGKQIVVQYLHKIKRT
jgi:hypothetical protein